MKNVNKFILSCIIALSFIISARGQNTGFGIIAATIIDKPSQQPVAFATLAVHEVSDSSVVAGSIADSAGNISVENIKYGNYYAKISFVGYEDTIVQSFSISALHDNIELGNIELIPADNTLNAVVVSGQKKVVEIIPGGFVYNADQILTNANGTTFDMMKNIPGVIVDKDEHISIRGNTAITVLIDGNPTNLSGDDLTNFLKQIPANMISSVDILTNPTAKYDAAGGGGIIDIKMKQNKTAGNNGTVSAGAGTLGSYNASANYFSNSSKINFSASYSYDHNVNIFSLSGIRENYNNPDPIYYYDEVFNQDMTDNNQLFKTSLDYTINTKNTIGGSFLYGYNSGNFDISDITNLLYPDKSESGSFVSLFQYNSNGNNYDANLHYTLKFDKPSHDIKFGFNYSDYAHNNSIRSNSNFYNAAGGLIDGSSTLRNDSTQFGVNIYTAKVDYTLPINETSKIEAGIKNTYTKTDNNLLSQTYDSITNAWENDYTTSNNFTYKENVSAGYITYSSSIKKITYQLGLRSEYTSITTLSETTADNYSDTYIDLFPSANIKYALKKGGEISLDYSRRIDRPIYQWLNPFVDKSTPYTWFTGNPDLKPYYTNAATINYSKFIAGKYFINASMFYQNMQNVFTQYLEPGEEEGIYYMTIKNISSQNNIGVSLMTQDAFAKWLNVVSNFALFKNSVTNELASVTPDSKISFTGYLNASFKFWQNTTFQITANYISPITTLQGYFGGYYSVDAGIKKSFIHDHLSVNITLSDVFNTQKFDTQLLGDAFNWDGTFKPTSRIGSISVSWRLGDAMQNMQQNTDTDDQKRVNFQRS